MSGQIDKLFSNFKIEFQEEKNVDIYYNDIKSLISTFYHYGKLNPSYDYSNSKFINKIKDYVAIPILNCNYTPSTYVQDLFIHVVILSWTSLTSKDKDMFNLLLTISRPYKSIFYQTNLLPHIQDNYYQQIQGVVDPIIFTSDTYDQNTLILLQLHHIHTLHLGHTFTFLNIVKLLLKILLLILRSHLIFLAKSCIIPN